MAIIESAFLSDFCIAETEQEGIWILHQPLIYQSAKLGIVLAIPDGFKTDFASVPRVPIIYEQFGDRAHRESVVHDWLYYTGVYRRSVADYVFWEAMKVRGKSAWVRSNMWLGVRIGGWKAWNEHRRNGHPKA